MLLKRNNSFQNIFKIATPFYIIILITSLGLIILTLVNLKDYIKVPGVYTDNTIIYTTLDNEIVELEDKTVNIYEENHKIYVYYHKDDVKKITTSKLVHGEIKTSLFLLFYFSVPYWIFVVIFIKILKEDKYIIKNGKKICVNILEVEYDNDKLFGNHMIIKANYRLEDKKYKTFVSDKIYNDKQKKEIKNTGSVDIYYLEDNIDKYVVYEYHKKPTIEW